MAGPLIEKIEKNFLSCCICFEELRDPIGLPCLHGFCFKCLDRWSKTSKDKTRVICPSCKQPAPMPKNGIRGFPGHFLVKNLKETVDREKKGQVITCSLCGKQAERHCIDCNKSLCQPCLKNHNAFTKDHKVVTTEEFQSGQVTDEGRFCETHGEQVRYYCKTEEKGVCADCVGLKTCPNEHHRITLKEAAKKHESELEDRVKKCRETKAKLEDAVKETKAVQQDLRESKRQTISDIDKLENDYVKRVKQVFQGQRDTVNKLEMGKSKEIEGKLKILDLGIGQIQAACDQVSEIQRSKSEYLITHRYPTLTTTLTDLSQAQPKALDKTVGLLKFEPLKVEVPHFGFVMLSKRWKLSDEFVMANLSEPESIAIEGKDNIVVGSWKQGIKVFTKSGLTKGTVYDTHGVADVTITSDNRCIFSPHNLKCIQCNNLHGNQLSITPVTDVNNQPSNANSIAIDSKGRIIVGQVNNTISIHHADGSLISKFATKSRPLRLKVTSNGEIVSSCYDDALKRSRSVLLMDYSGHNVRVIQPPVEVKKWNPTYMCCRQGEIFVVNNRLGSPTGVYRYTAEGDYLGCVTTEVNEPKGIAISDDGMELYVAECGDISIKTFQRHGITFSLQPPWGSKNQNAPISPTSISNY